MMLVLGIEWSRWPTSRWDNTGGGESDDAGVLVADGAGAGATAVMPALGPPNSVADLLPSASERVLVELGCGAKHQPDGQPRLGGARARLRASRVGRRRLLVDIQAKASMGQHVGRTVRRWRPGRCGAWSRTNPGPADR